MNVSELLQSGAKVLRLNKIETHQLDSELVLSNLLKKRRENLIINSNQNVSENTILNFNKPKSKKRTVSIYFKKQRILE